MRYEKMKLMELAKLAYEMDKYETIDFANCSSEDVDYYGGWCGIKKANPFDNDNLAFMIGRYGGEANTRFYQISEYDAQIGDFCEHYLGRYVNGSWRSPSDEDYIICIAKAISDFILDYEGYISENIVVDL